ncbi:hypothetical protein [Halocynthiibacter sp.]|uniref:hypothetical protein n=1 Tax=Halocynthiibacter sp. TaxID=1979210 RepID=UPI003C5A32C0
MSRRKEIAEEVGLQVGWFSQLCSELNVEPSSLRERMKDFKAKGDVPQDLLSAYPTERGIEKFGSGKGYPQNKTIDFILTFLNSDLSGDILEKSTRQQCDLTFVRFGVAIIREKQGQHFLAVTRSLDAETLRRKDYWEMRQDHINGVLCGTYFLARPSLTRAGNLYNGSVYGEILHIKKSKVSSPVLNAYWWRWSQHNTIFYVGNLFITAGFLYGTFVNYSTDEIIKPANLSIAVSPTRREAIPQFVLTGSLMGTNYSQDTIINYPLALRRMQNSEIPEPHIYDMNTGTEGVTRDNFSVFANKCLEKLSDSHFSESSFDYMIQNISEYGALEMARKRT